MVQARPGSKVKMNYTGTLEDGTIFDSSDNSGAIDIVIGQGQLIPKLEEALIGMELNESKTVNITAEEAYGPYDQALVMDIEKSKVPPDLNPQVGDQLQISKSENENIPVTVTALNDDSISLDANHPLAGKNLTFEVELIEIQSQFEP